MSVHFFVGTILSSLERKILRSTIWSHFFHKVCPLLPPQLMSFCLISSLNSYLWYINRLESPILSLNFRFPCVLWNMSFHFAIVPYYHYLEYFLDFIFILHQSTYGNNSLYSLLLLFFDYFHSSSIYHNLSDI